jgi:hypothetical protein
MIATFLKAKHWQIFLLTFGIPIILQVVFMGVMISKLSSSEVPEVPDKDSIVKFFTIIPIIMSLFMAVFLGWFWSVSTGLQDKLPKDVTMKLAQFKVFFFIPVIYIFSIFIVVALFLKGILDADMFRNTINMGIFISILLLFHLFSMFCMFHTLYFTAKTFKTVDLQKETRFEDFVGEFFLIWFFPIGIWILQPKINEIVETTGI